MKRLRVQFVASEMYPLAKTGGLAGVCSGLPLSLTRLGADVRVVLPGYEQALDTAGWKQSRALAKFSGAGSRTPSLMPTRGRSRTVRRPALPSMSRP